MAQVLLVEDDQTLLMALANALSVLGHQVVTAVNGKEALAIFRQSPPDATITDIKMPEMSGLELLREIRKIDPKASFLVITAYPTLEGMVEAIDLGVVDYLTKPFKVAELEAGLDRALAKRKAT
jgi:two-component system NtrC family response regulator